MLDEPTANPVLGLEAYAATLAELITYIRTRRLQHLNVAQKAVPLHHVPRLWLEYFRDNPPAQSGGPGYPMPSVLFAATRRFAPLVIRAMSNEQSARLVIRAPMSGAVRRCVWALPKGGAKRCLKTALVMA